MNRRSFFKFLGIGAATAVVAPKMLEKIKPSKITYTVDDFKWEPLIKMKRASAALNFPKAGNYIFWQAGENIYAGEFVRFDKGVCYRSKYIHEIDSQAVANILKGNYGWFLLPDGDKVLRPYMTPNVSPDPKTEWYFVRGQNG